MAKNITLESTEFAILHYALPNENDHESNPAPLAVHDELYLKFQQPTDGTEFKKIYRESGAGIYPPKFGISASLGRTSYSSDKTEKAIRIGLLPREFDPQSITYATKQADELLGYIDIDNAFMAQHGSVWVELHDAAKLIDAVKTGVAMAVADSDQPAGYQFKTIGTGRGEIGLTIDETTTCGLVVTPLSPLSGSAPAQADNTFAWEITDPGECLAELKPTAVTFAWRDTDGSTMQQMPLSADARSVTIPAGTFAGHTEIEWWVTVTANSGEVTISDGVTLSTADVRSKAVVISPIGTIVDSAKDMIFRWLHIIETKTPQNGALLQKSEDGIDWETLVEMIGRDQDWLFPAGTLSTKIKYWRVATRNSDDVLGEWSDPAKISVIAAPDRPVLKVESTQPRPIISWTAADQVAYQVRVSDLAMDNTVYGLEQTWQSPEYLSDGPHDVFVRVQNQYGLWSDWGRTTILIANVSDDEIKLSVQSADAAELYWLTDGTYDFYLIYKDGKLIGRTMETNYIDMVGIGNVTYQVRGCYAANSNYTLSSEVTVDVTVQYVTVSDMDTGVILALPYSESAHRTTARTLSRSVQAVQLAGRAYPIIERSEHCAESVSVACAFADPSDCAVLESMVGHIVGVRTPEAHLVVGCLAQLTERSNSGLYRAYTFTVDQADWEEAIDIDA